MRTRTLVPVIATTLATGAAAGAPAPEPGGPPPAAPHTVLTASDAVRRYWTPSRMRATTHAAQEGTQRERATRATTRHNAPGTERATREGAQRGATATERATWAGARHGEAETERTTQKGPRHGTAEAERATGEGAQRSAAGAGRAAWAGMGYGAAGVERATGEGAQRSAAGAGRAAWAGMGYGAAGVERATRERARPGAGEVERPRRVEAGRSVARVERVAWGGRRAGGLWVGGGVVARTTGKVFFTIGGRDSLCSAGVVRSDNRDVVVTAAHCVKPPGQGWAENWIFVPGYRDGVSPYGGFTARRMFVPEQWTRDGDGDFDVAFVALSPADGRHVRDAVGGLSIAFGGPDGSPVHAFGYPSVAPYDGERLAYCDGRPARDPNGATAGRGLRCDMTRGSSGGPWLTGFDPSTGRGTVASVSSFKYANDGGTLYGPRFGDVVRRLYERARVA